MGEGNHAFGFHEAEGVRVGAVIVFVVSPLAVVAVLAGWAVPNSVVRMDLLAETTAMGEWKGSFGVAGRHFLVVVLRHGEPPEAVIAGVFYSRG